MQRACSNEDRMASFDKNERDYAGVNFQQSCSVASTAVAPQIACD